MFDTAELNDPMNPHQFWTGKDGDDYISRNLSGLPSRIAMWAKVLGKTRDVRSILEFGANIGLNIEAMAALLPAAARSSMYAVEPNASACTELRSTGLCDGVIQSTIANYTLDFVADLVIIRGVLIHTPAEDLEESYRKIYRSSRRYICLAEYYAPKREMINYRGRDNLLWRDDFAGEMLARFNDLRLVDYFFVSKHDPNFPQDDVTVWLMEKLA
jgi:pseudaminic acid biosynthesis-associated methylase